MNECRCCLLFLPLHNRRLTLLVSSGHNLFINYKYDLSALMLMLLLLHLSFASASVTAVHMSLSVGCWCWCCFTANNVDIECWKRKKKRQRHSTHETQKEDSLVMNLLSQHCNKLTHLINESGQNWAPLGRVHSWILLFLLILECVHISPNRTISAVIIQGRSLTCNSRAQSPVEDSED